MKTAFLIIFVLFGFVQSQNCDKKTMQNSNNTISPTPKAMTNFDKNLPENIKSDMEVRVDKKNDKGEIISEITTVGKRLNELNARYENNKLVDGKGKEVRFYQVLCRGASAGDEQDEIDRKAAEKELAELEKKYTVIVVLCDPSKVM